LVIGLSIHIDKYFPSNNETGWGPTSEKRHG
jgi:hypothetical protein